MSNNVSLSSTESDFDGVSHTSTSLIDEPTYSINTDPDLIAPEIPNIEDESDELNFLENVPSSDESANSSDVTSLNLDSNRSGEEIYSSENESKSKSESESESESDLALNSETETDSDDHSEGYQSGKESSFSSEKESSSSVTEKHVSLIGHYEHGFYEVTEKGDSNRIFNTDRLWNLLKRMKENKFFKKKKELNELDLTIFMNTLSGWNKINLFRFDRSLIQKIEHLKLKYESAYEMACSWVALGTFQFEIMVDAELSGNRQPAVLSINKSKIYIQKPKSSESPSHILRNDYLEDLVEESQKRKAYFRAGWGHLRFWISRTKPTEIVIQSAESGSVVGLTTLNEEIKLAIAFTFQIYNSSKGKDYRVGRNDKIESINLQTIQYFVMPNWRGKQLRPIASKIGSYSHAKRQLQNYLAISKRYHQKKQKNLKRGFLDDNQTAKKTKGRKNVDLNLKLKKRNNEKGMKNQNSIITINDFQKSKNKISKAKTCTPLKAIILGSSNNPINPKQMHLIEILKNKNEEFFKKRQYQRIEWHYFDDFGAKLYYQQRKAIFQVYVIVNKIYPIQPGFLFLEKSFLKIQAKNFKIKIPFTNDFLLKSLQENEKLFQIQSPKKKWKYNKNTFLLAKSTNDSKLIIRAIQYFYKQWWNSKNKSRKNRYLN
ncbi:hypothetical protein M0813_28825 [Anaeramoeba flamelloides]|uniref:Uncharacterized protein n=1 Tax=Anaeramoeba flamelloides TaxID=1746091 RepID=A0ABQ8XQG0_9EUKA|nr:hypothetical protein M0813_28825 [Anaeramoeba flamelloides]